MLSALSRPNSPSGVLQSSWFQIFQCKYKDFLSLLNINLASDIGDFMLTEFEKGKHNVDYLITFANTVKKKFTKQKDEIEM